MISVHYVKYLGVNCFVGWRKPEGSVFFQGAIRWTQWQNLCHEWTSQECATRAATHSG